MTALVAIHPELFKIGARGQVQCWTIAVYRNGDVGEIVIKWGEVDGKVQEAKEIVREGKNLGKKNETTPVEQAVDQARSRWEKQKDKYYAETVDEAKKLKSKCTRPMLAQKLHERAHRLEVGEKIYVQPKLDGMRCIAVRLADRVELISRGQKPITATPHVAEALFPVMGLLEIWDGELYRHDMCLEEIISACRPKKPNDISLTMEYHIFDTIAPLPFDERFLLSALQRIVQLPKDLPIRAVRTTEMPYDPTKMDQIREDLEKEGWEGTIVRLARQEQYEHKKTMNLLKDKSFIDDEFEIVGSQTGKSGSRKDGLLVNFVLATTNAKGEPDTFEASLMGQEPRLKEMWGRREEFVGQMAMVKYQDLTKKGLPHFGKVKAVRWEGDMCAPIDLTEKS